MKKVGYNTIRALSVGGAFGDLRDDWDYLTDKEKFWLDVLPWSLVIPAIVLLVGTFLLGGTTVHVSARTEHLIYTPLYSDPPVWILKDAEFESNDLEEIDLFASDDDLVANKISTEHEGEQHDPVNGFLQLSCGDRVTVSRVGAGRIKVHVNSINGVVITDELGNISPITSHIKKSFFFYPHSNQKSESNDAISYVWAMEGQVIPSRPVSIDTLTNQGLMLSGRVDLLNRRFIGGGNYLVSSHELELGDHLVLATAKDTEKKRDEIISKKNEDRNFVIEENRPNSSERTEYCESLRPDNSEFKSLFSSSSPTDKGFIHIDEEKGMAVSLISNAKSVEIARYRSTAVKLERSALSRLQNDSLFAVGWSVLLFTFFISQKLKRAYIMSRGRQEKLHYSDADSSSATDGESEPATDNANASNRIASAAVENLSSQTTSETSSVAKDSDSSNE